jgi:hypothetical protein
MEPNKPSTISGGQLNTTNSLAASGSHAHAPKQSATMLVAIINLPRLN